MSIRVSGDTTKSEATENDVPVHHRSDSAPSPSFSQPSGCASSFHAPSFSPNFTQIISVLEVEGLQCLRHSF